MRRKLRAYSSTITPDWRARRKTLTYNEIFSEEQFRDKIKEWNLQGHVGIGAVSTTLRSAGKRKSEGVEGISTSTDRIGGEKGLESSQKRQKMHLKHSPMGKLKLGSLVILCILTLF